MINILIVDDISEVAMALKRSVERLYEDANIIISDNSYEALEEAKSGKYDIIFCNYLMPEIMGGDFIDEVLNFNPEQEIILISGYPQATVAVEKYGISVLEKPWTLDELRDILDVAVKRRGIDTSAGGVKASAENAFRHVQGTSRRLREEGEENPVELVFEFPTPDEMNRFIMMISPLNYAKLKESTTLQNKYVAKVMVYPRYEISFLRDEQEL